MHAGRRRVGPMGRRQAIRPTGGLAKQGRTDGSMAAANLTGHYEMNLSIFCSRP